AAGRGSPRSTSTVRVSCRERLAATRIQCGKLPWRRIDGTGWPVSMMRKGGGFDFTWIKVPGCWRSCAWYESKGKGKGKGKGFRLWRVHFFLRAQKETNQRKRAFPDKANV